MNKKLEAALDSVEMTYGEVIEVANDITSSMFSPINALVSDVNSKINSLSIDQIRDFILKLQLKAFEISETKEKAALKADLAAALQKEKFAESFNSMEGAAAVKEKLALVDTASEVIAESLYNLIANLFKTKLDQLHRLVDSLKSILMSRMQENKFMQNMTVGEQGERTYLGE